MASTLKIGMGLWLVCGAALCGLCEATALAAPPILPPVAILRVGAMHRSYRLGDVVVLKTTVTNISRSDICFEPSSPAAFEVQLYDVNEEPGVDQILPAMPERPVGNARRSICSTIHPGKSEKRNIVLKMLPNLVNHAGVYKMMVGRKEVGSKQTIWALPFLLRMTAA